jgi:hypothetical protein
MLKTMSFKELSAWIMMGICLIAGAAYALVCYFHFAATGEWIVPLVPFVLLSIITILLSIPTHIVAAILKRETANEAEDERDIAIRHKAGYMSGLCLGFTVVAALVLTVLNTNPFLLFHMIVACLVISQVVEYGAQIISYRRMSAIGEA